MKINKASAVEKSDNMDSAAMEKINRLSRRTLGADEVYIFKVKLCDNEVDRDGDAFTTDALYKLKELFVGKTGILNHDAKAENQLARIFDTWVDVSPEESTTLGERYTCLMAAAYIPRTAENAEIIEKIDTGILKEVSVSCAVKRVLCAECGEPYGSCEHTGKIRRLDGAADAYEFSFVAVPAQRSAGVTKKFEGTASHEPAEVGVTLTKSEHLELTKLADIGREYRRKLRSEIKRNAAIIHPGLSGEIMDTMTEELDFDGLEKLNKAYGKMASERLPIYEEAGVQTRAEFII